MYRVKWRSSIIQLVGKDCGHLRVSSRFQIWTSVVQMVSIKQSRTLFITACSDLVHGSLLEIKPLVVFRGLAF